ncbi:MAG: phosphoribosylformylglycinamidine synthase subunit PurQ [Armatimonadetes bacterium]|nr:phosphoribosylformylglycinamidine synthase subunit PurQ [Armatimonadota bacterium]
MKFGVVQFPGSNGDQDAYNAVCDVLKQPVEYIWHKSTAVDGFDCIIIPGGASYGDYLRPGAVASLSPVIDAIRGYADQGGRVIGIGNGFQILCEAGLLPGALMTNSNVRFKCSYISVRVENNFSDFSHKCTVGQTLSLPIEDYQGSYYCNADELKPLESENSILLRYCDKSGKVTYDANPNGSALNIAGILNEAGNVAGMMPHPERAVDDILGSADGVLILKSIAQRLD